MLKRGWRETEGDEWDIHWAERDWINEHFDTMHLNAWQKVNHFRNDRELCRKDLLVKNLKKYKRQLQRNKSSEADLYDFWPTTYVLPGDYALFAEEFKRNPSSTWIMKPVGRAQGKGIFIFQKLSQISKWKNENRYGGGGSSDATDGSKKSKSEARGADAEAYVVQRYIANPYLVAGRKYDMRIYALVTTYSPLTVWLYRGGFCRFSSARYSNSAADLENVFMHLTNVAIQKKSADYAKDEHGGKWDLRHLKLYLMSRYGVVMVDRLFNEIQMIILRSLLAVQQIIIQDKHCFELYGYDVLFDDTFKPWLVEVNASPSLSASTPDDYEMKTTMLSSMLDIIDLEGKLKGDEVRVGGFDLVYRDGHVGSSPGCTYSTMLGAEVPIEHTKRRTPSDAAKSIAKPIETPRSRVKRTSKLAKSPAKSAT